MHYEYFRCLINVCIGLCFGSVIIIVEMWDSFTLPEPCYTREETNSIFINRTSVDGFTDTGDKFEFEKRLKSILKCHDHSYQAEVLQRGDFWVLKNYIRADHGELKCTESITYTTHSDYTFLDNLIPLLERWMAPISLAMYAPGSDFQATLDSIKYLRECLPKSLLVRYFTTFHIYFDTEHIPERVPKSSEALSLSYNCTITPPYLNVTSRHLNKTQNKLKYPINVGRNIARDASLTHFILPSDIELYPSPGLVKLFLKMIARNEAFLHRKYPRVFPLSIFEVKAKTIMPRNKTELLQLVLSGKVIPFHSEHCSLCHSLPRSNQWILANATEDMSVFHIGKRKGAYYHWEPIYIGTNAEPHYDERLSWEGKSDKMTQGYALCALDYEFHILDNAFLVHRHGIKLYKKDPLRDRFEEKTVGFLKNKIFPELKVMYGTRKGCEL